jgi:hypothetical protein
MQYRGGSAPLLALKRILSSFCPIPKSTFFFEKNAGLEKIRGFCSFTSAGLGAGLCAGLKKSSAGLDGS